MRFFMFIFLCACSVCPNFLFAQGFIDTRGETIQSLGVALRDVTLDQVVYATGDEATLTFRIENAGDVVRPDVTYRVDIVGVLDETNKPTTTYRVGTMMPVPILAPGETYAVTHGQVFDQALPANSIALQVHVFVGGDVLLAQEAVPCMVTGQIAALPTVLAQIQIDGDPFSLLANPTLYKGEQVAFATSIRGTGVTEMITPTITMYRKGEPDPVQTFLGEMIPIQRTKSTEQKIMLPHFEYTPGMYTAVVTYVNTEGVVRVGPLYARYIVAGVGPSITYALPTTLSLEQNQSFAVEVLVAPAPRDIQLDTAFATRKKMQQAEIEITVIDAHNMVVARQRVPIAEDTVSVHVPFVATQTMYGMRLVATLFVQGVVVDTYDVSLPDATSMTVAGATQTVTSNVTKLPWGGIAIGFGALCVIGVGGFWYARKKRGDAVGR